MSESNSEFTALLHSVERRLRRLSLERLRVADDFLAYLEERESDVATQELLSLAEFEDRYHQALEQAENGEVVPFERIRRDV